MKQKINLASILALLFVLLISIAYPVMAQDSREKNPYDAVVRSTLELQFNLAQASRPAEEMIFLPHFVVALEPGGSASARAICPHEFDCEQMIKAFLTWGGACWDGTNNTICELPPALPE